MKTRVQGTIQGEKLSSTADRDTLWLAVIRGLSDIRDGLRGIKEAKTLEEAQGLAEKALIALDELESEKSEMPEEPSDEE